MADPRHPRRFTEEFKRQIVQLCENGKPPVKIEREYDIYHSTLHRWVQGIRNSGSTKAADNRTPEQNEPVELRKRNRQLEMEADVSEQEARRTGPGRSGPRCAARASSCRAAASTGTCGGTTTNGSTRPSIT